MTARQIRIACDGFVISTRPFPDPITYDEIVQIDDAIKADFVVLLKHGSRVTVWVDEAGSNVAHLMGGAR
jgi:hypothetical protein